MFHGPFRRRTSSLIATVAGILAVSCGGVDHVSYLKNNGCAVPITSSSNHERCEQLIEGLLPFDDSFNTAPDPAQYRRRVARAYRAILEYPLDLPRDGRILGMSPGTIPLSVYSYLGSGERSQEDLRITLFNYAMSAVQRLSYDPSDMDHNFVAWMGLTPSLGGHLAVRPLFFSDEAISRRAGEIYRAGVILHESRHADGMWHIPCTGPRTVVVGDWTCDADMNGLYGFEAMYNQAAMRGGAISGYLNQNEVRDVGQVACITIQLSVNRLPDELDRVLSATKCFKNVTYQWLLNNGAIPSDSKALPVVKTSY